MSEPLSIWPVVERAIFNTRLRRSAIDFEWPECHRAKCRREHSDPDWVFSIFAERVAESVSTALTLESLKETKDTKAHDAEQQRIGGVKMLDALIAAGGLDVARLAEMRRELEEA